MDLLNLSVEGKTVKVVGKGTERNGGVSDICFSFTDGTLLHIGATTCGSLISVLGNSEGCYDVDGKWITESGVGSGGLDKILVPNE